MAAGNLHPQNRISVRKTKNDFKTFFSHVTKDFKKGKSSAPMEKKKLIHAATPDITVEL
jgi:endo-1,4-beta-mannosidase